MAPELQEGWLGTITGNVYLAYFSVPQSEIARGVPLSVYMNLDVYSGFWCTSHCVVF